MICPPHAPAPIVENWLERHRHPVSLVLHIVGIPPTIVGVLLIPVYIVLLSIPVFLFALSCFIGGYALQFLGHTIDGTEVGEIVAIRRYFERRRELGRGRRHKPTSGG